MTIINVTKPLQVSGINEFEVVGTLVNGANGVSVITDDNGASAIYSYDDTTAGKTLVEVFLLEDEDAEELPHEDDIHTELVFLPRITLDDVTYEVAVVTDEN